MSHAKSAPDWAATHPDEIARCVAIALNVVKTDVTKRVPRKEEERQNAYADWLAKQREKYLPLIETAVAQEFLALSEVMEESAVRFLIEQYAWPEAAAWLRSYALRGQAAAWVVQYLGDALTIGEPVFDKGYWRVPLGLKQYGDDLGYVTLDANGTILPALTSTREAILENAHDRAVPSAATASG